MQVRMKTFEITEADRRAIRFVKDGRKTMCTRDEAKAWIDMHVNAALADLRYRWEGPKVSAAVANGANPDGIASQTAAINTPPAGAEKAEKAEEVVSA